MIGRFVLSYDYDTANHLPIEARLELYEDEQPRRGPGLHETKPSNWVPCSRTRLRFLESATSATLISNLYFKWIPCVLASDGIDPGISQGMITCYLISNYQQDSRESLNLDHHDPSVNPLSVFWIAVSSLTCRIGR